MPTAATLKTIPLGAFQDLGTKGVDITVEMILIEEVMTSLMLIKDC